MIGTACSTYLIDLTKDADHIDLQMIALVVFFVQNKQMMSFGANLWLHVGIAHICQQRNTNLFVCQTDWRKIADHIDLQMLESSVERWYCPYLSVGRCATGLREDEYGAVLLSDELVEVRCT